LIFWRSQNLGLIERVFIRLKIRFSYFSPFNHPAKLRDPFFISIQGLPDSSSAQNNEHDATSQLDDR
jgi:hypothetical protein